MQFLLTAVALAEKLEAAANFKITELRLFLNTATMGEPRSVAGKQLIWESLGLLLLSLSLSLYLSLSLSLSQRRRTCVPVSY